MLIPIRCFTCGKIIADKYDYYLKEVEKQQKENISGGGPKKKTVSEPPIAESSAQGAERAKAAKAQQKEKDKDKTKGKPEAVAESNSDSDNDEYKQFDSLKTGEILNKLGLHRYCCRRHMLATVDMMEVI